jgi:hypothetical protein
MRLRGIEQNGLSNSNSNSNEELLMNELSNLKEENNRLKESLFNLQTLTVETNSLVMKLLNNSNLLNNSVSDEENESNVDEENDVDNDSSDENNDNNELNVNLEVSQ